ncbi:MAG: hypothetical protein NXI04_20755 [Planctomycetaceae bacterium]|nr:hypothetical protein [Planctomycetaceae bacterium]
MSASPMPREEYIEQEYFFRVYRERLQESVPSQEILKTIHEEILSTTQLPMAIDFMRAEILHTGRISDAMSRLSHYFTPFQAFVIGQAEEDVSRFDQITGLEILEREAKYRAGEPTMAGVFVYQFECIARNRLGYDRGLAAMSQDPLFTDRWQKWIRSLRTELGAFELSELVFRQSGHFRQLREKKTGQSAADEPEPLFGAQEGRIAKANIGRDPLYFFAALQRQLAYPSVPLSTKAFDETLPGFLEQRLAKIEQRLKIIELEQKGGIDLTRFYKTENGETPHFRDDPGLP